jgi:hypothetical protein
MNDLARSAAAIKQRVRECEAQAKAYGLWLTALLPANLILVVGAAVLSAIAGASILVKNSLITDQQAAYLALLSTVFTIVHNGFGCDAHQRECKKLRATYDSMRFRYHALEALVDIDVVSKQLTDLDTKLAAIKEAATARPPSWCFGKWEVRY